MSDLPDALLPPPTTTDARLGLAELLRRRKADLIEAWKRRVLEDPDVPEANRLPEPQLRDDMPLFVDHLVQIACLHHTPGQFEERGRALGDSAASRGHAQKRHEQGYSLEAALREWSHFRAAIIGLCAEEHLVLDRETNQFLHAAIDESVARVAMEMHDAASAALVSSEHHQRALAQHLREEVGVRERVMAILSHDLRNPLNTVLMGATALLQHEGIAEGHAVTLRRICSATTRMGRMVDDLLDLTRAQLGTGVLITPREIDLRDVCEHVLGEFEVSDPTREVALSAEGVTTGKWDPDRMAQLLSNLVRNALTHGTGDGHVHVALRGFDAVVELEVRNESAALAPGLLATAFEAFTRGPAADVRGHGLGLFIVRQIAQAHGGGVVLSSAGGEPTIVTVNLPRGTASTDAQQ